MENYYIAALLGVIEGLTEFLPVSSTGHLIIASEVFNFNPPPGHTFEVMIQLGAILALCIFYARKLFGYAFTLHNSAQSQKMAGVLLAGMFPAIILGLLFHGYIKTVLFNPHVVAVALIVGGIILLIVDRYKKTATVYSVDDISVRTAFLIGVAQAAALIPGISRSGATIVGGVLCNLDKRTAAEFSFLLSIPIMGAAFGYDAYKNFDNFDFSSISLITIGFLTAFISALLVVKPFLAIISRVGFTPFAIYRIGIGILLLAYL